MGHYDAIVVGAGYAGLACAAQLAGRRVLVLERHESVVNKQRGCLGLHLPFGQAMEVRGEDLYLQGLDLLVEGGVRARIGRVEIRGQQERVLVSLDRPLVVIDERRLKGALLRRVREQGTEVRLQASVREIATDGREALVRADEEHRARILVGADGAHSLVARRLMPRREKLGLMFQREAEVDRLDLAPETLLLQLDDVSNWFSGISLGDRALVSVVQFVTNRGVPKDLEAQLQDRIERLGAGRRLAGRSAIVRLYAPASHAVSDNLLICGDALSAFGWSSISGALSMGTLAGRSVQRFLAGSRYALPHYEEHWREDAGQVWLERLRWSKPLLSRFKAHRVDALIRAVRGRGDRSVVGQGALWWRLPAVLTRLFM
ncbi:MAG: NAD(P)/FAD-dependent oxidoreductase [Deltaproteobacteria bacterium]|nr:NAD(P)/FAD-dependent oxidoreductase [Deltaproteobacteria bacterium]